jgi:uncharacterized membrane protein
LTEENDQDEQVNRELPSRADFIGLLICITITAFCVWVINSYESAQQGYKWVIFGSATLFSGLSVFFFISNIIEKIVNDKARYRRRINSFPLIFFGLLLNGFGISRLYESFESSDANNDGLFTITDINIHAKETFFAVGDRFTVLIANTDVGQFFEMNTITPSPLLAFIVSVLLWGILWKGLHILITGED